MNLPAETLQRQGGEILGIVIPLAVFISSTLLTWLLYRHFSRKTRDE